MKKIYQIIGSSVMFPAEVVAETELSYVGRCDFGEDLEQCEYCYPKSEENVKWFWTKEEAEAKIEKSKEINAKIEALKKELESV